MVSPLYDHLGDLPPIFLAACTNEVLYNDATRLANKAKEAGNDLTFNLVEDSVHVFTIFPFLQEAGKTLAEFADWAIKVCQKKTSELVI